MNKKSRFVFFGFAVLGALLCMEVFYINATKSMNRDSREAKLQFIRLSGLPDLAISTEATYVRHRSMSDLFSIYKDDGSLREYFPSTFAYSHSHTINREIK